MAHLISHVRQAVHAIRSDLRDLEISDDELLSNIGFNSFDFVKLVLQLENDLDINIIDADVSAKSLSSVSTIAAFLKERFGIAE